jgi:hypothetical protein
MADNKPPYLPLDVLNVIAGKSLVDPQQEDIMYYWIRGIDPSVLRSHHEQYQQLLAIPRFARSTLKSANQLNWQRHFTCHCIDSKICHIACDDPKHASLPESLPDHNFKVSWFLDGKLHRVDGPAYVHVANGIVYSLNWFINGQEHREDGPARIESMHNNSIPISTIETWFYRGKIHRENGPAITIYYRNGVVKSHQWYKHDKRHRVDKPAVIEYNIHGRVLLYEYYLNGTHVKRC